MSNNTKKVKKEVEKLIKWETFMKNCSTKIKNDNVEVNYTVKELDKDYHAICTFEYYCDSSGDIYFHLWNKIRYDLEHNLEEYKAQKELKDKIDNF